MEENDYDCELCAEGSDTEPEEASSSSSWPAMISSSASSLPPPSTANLVLPLHIPPVSPGILSTMTSSRHSLPSSSVSITQSDVPAVPVTSSSSSSVSTALEQTVVQPTVAPSATPLQVAVRASVPLSSSSACNTVHAGVQSIIAPSAAPLQSVAPASAPLSTSNTSSSSMSSSQTYPKLSRLEEQNTLKEELSLVRQTKVICSLDLLLNVFKKCQHPGCTKETSVKHHLNGPTAVIKWACSSGHKGTYSSSKDQNGIYCNNLQVAASIMLSGNNFFKVEKLAKFIGLAFISDSTFYRMQRLYFIPAIDEWWSWQRSLLVRDFLDKEVVVCGDGQCDSPGHTAKNLCYFLMELVSGYILEIEVRDKRHVGLASSNMEKQALQNALQRLQASLNIVEVVTDASSTIKKLLGKHYFTLSYPFRAVITSNSPSQWDIKSH